VKIAMFTDHFYPELGGIQDSVAILSRALGRRGHRVRILAPRYAVADYRLVGADAGDGDLGANVCVRRRGSLPFPSSTRQSRAALPSPFGWARLVDSERPDLIHVHSFFGIGLEALLSAAALRVPLVGTNHWTVAGFAPFLPVAASWAAGYVAWFYNRCDFVTAPSRSVFEELGEHRLRRPHRVVSNPIDGELFAPASAAERVRLRAAFGLREPTVTFAGRLGVEKNVAVLLHAIARLGDGVQLVLAGHGAHEPALRALAVQLGIVPRVRFLGTLPQTRLADLLRASDVFAIMSTSETQSMVMLQAMAAGLPVVAARTRALPEFVSPESGLLVDPHDPDAIATALREVLAVPERRAALGAAARRLAEHYSVAAVADVWEEVYREVLRGREGR
jgi:glycosyltransferase involved in cell wall biosynthesis